MEEKLSSKELSKKKSKQRLTIGICRATTRLGKITEITQILKKILLIVLVCSHVPKVHSFISQIVYMFEANRLSLQFLSHVGTDPLLQVN